MSLYTVLGKPFDSFLEAVREADAYKTQVIETATGKARWTPPPPVSSKRQRMHRERLAAYKAQEAGKVRA